MVRTASSLVETVSSENDSPMRQFAADANDQRTFVFFARPKIPAK
jgi:hypothetical protein